MCACSVNSAHFYVNFGVFGLGLQVHGPLLPWISIVALSILITTMTKQKSDGQEVCL